jgi:hypothetical protein
MARYLPIALASLVLSTAFVLPALAHRGSGRDVDPPMTGIEGVPPSAGSGSRAKPDRPTLTKSEETYELWICKPTQGYDCDNWTLQGSYSASEWDIMADVFRGMGYGVHRG